jgi:hypothetical protein
MSFTPKKVKNFHSKSAAVAGMTLPTEQAPKTAASSKRRLNIANPPTELFCFAARAAAQQLSSFS